MENQKPFFKIIDELCKEKEIKQKYISYGWIRELRKDNKVHYIMKYQFDLNSEISYTIAGDKFATFEVLKSNNIPTIEHKIIFNPKTRSVYYENKFVEEVKQLLKKNNDKLVIKANDSCKGKDVYFCSTEEEIEKVIKKLFEEKNDTLSACPYLNIDYEYRAIYLSGEIIYIYKKKKPYIIGDGKNNLKYLIEKKEIENKIKIEISKNLDLKYVPQLNEEVTISWKHNLSNGAEPVILKNDDEHIKEVEKIALLTGNALNIKFASIDIAVTSDKRILVMEVNGNVCMNKFAEIIPNGYEISKQIYSKAIDKMFE